MPPPEGFVLDQPDVPPPPKGFVPLKSPSSPPASKALYKTAKKKMAPASKGDIFDQIAPSKNSWESAPIIVASGPWDADPVVSKMVQPEAVREPGFGGWISYINTPVKQGGVYVANMEGVYIWILIISLFLVIYVKFLRWLYKRILKIADQIRNPIFFLGCILCILIFLMLLFPPFQYSVKGVKHNAGYGFLFIPPTFRTGIDYGEGSASVNTTLLITQWICLLLIGGIALFIGKNNAKK